MQQGMLCSPSLHSCQMSAAVYNMFLLYYSSSFDTSAETSSRLASYDAPPMSSADPFAATVPQSVDGPSTERTTRTSNPEQGDFQSDHVESLPAPDSVLFPAPRLSTAPFTNYEQPPIHTTFPAPQSLTTATLRPDHAMPRTSTAPNFSRAYTSGSEGHDGSSSTFSSVPFGATATKHSALTETSRFLGSHTTHASTHPPNPSIPPIPTSSSRHMDHSSYATLDSGPSSSKERAKKSRPTKTASHAQSLHMPGTSAAAVLDHDEPHAAGAVVDAAGSKGKRKADDVEEHGNGKSDARPSKRVKSNNAEQKKKDIDRKYQRDCRLKANEKREKMLQLANIPTGKVAENDDARTCPTTFDTLIVQN